MATGTQVIAGQETSLPKQNDTGGVEQVGRSELLLRRSCSSSINRQYSSFNNGPRYHHPSRSMDFSQQEGGYCSLLTELGSTRGAHPDPGIYTSNRRRTKATGGGHVQWRWRWPRLRAGVFRRKRPLPELVGWRQTADESCQVPEEQKSAAAAMQLQDDDNQFIGSDDETDCSKEENLILNRGMTRNSSMVEHRHGKCPGLSHEHQPKVFEDIIGHEMIIKALSNAIQSMRISPLYLFYGPGGTGKTSAAKIFGMALNCESSSPSKPCWGCIGCSRSLYTADLCSANRTAGFAHIKTLLQSTGFKQTFPGIKVFIIDDCHTLSDDSWGELLDMIEQDKGCGSLVFIMIAEDVNMVPRAVSSRCQKFSFTKLKDTDIVLKLARIVSQEGIKIRNDALKLIAKKVEGDLREAENLLDQLALLGQTITASMVQQLVGLVPHEKLIHLLEAALCGDSIEALRSSKDLMAYNIEPRALVLQLASLITEILPSTSSSQMATSQDKSSAQGPYLLRNIQPKRVYQALKILIETEKQLRMTSSNHATWVAAALLQIASDDNSNHSSTSIVLPKDAYTSGNQEYEQFAQIIRSKNPLLQKNNLMISQQK